jgi:DNA polymerase-1
MSSPRKLVLVDGSSYLYRAFHALPPLSNSRGEPTGAVLGVLNMLQKLCKEEAPELIAVVFDAPGRTFRDDLFESYKAQRPPMPDDLRAQLQPLLDCVVAMGLPLLRIEGVEADDVIGTLATRAAADNVDVLISTGDKDMAQLVNERITLVNTMTGSRLDRDGVKAKFDVWPEQIVDYLALVGDTSDNIPGVPKVGPKTAAKWLNEYGTLDNLVAHADAITGKVGESLRASLKDLELSRKLATLDCNVPLEQSYAALVRREPDRERLRELYTRLELRSLLRQLEGPGDGETPNVVPAAPSAAVVPTNYQTVTTAQALAEWVERLRSAELVALHTKASGADYMQAELVGLSFAIEPGTAIYIPLAHDYPGAPTQIAREEALALLAPILTSEQPAKVGHHLKLDAHILKRHGIELNGQRFDAMLESYVWNGDAA